VLIQHLDRTHESHLAEAIGKSTGFPVAEIEDGVHVRPDHVYVIPPDRDVAIVDGTLALLPRSESRRPHLAVDFFFKTLAADRAGRAVGVVLSGTGADGSEGLRAIKAEGGITFAQDPPSAKFRGMPEAAIKAGAVDVVLPIQGIAEELVRLVGHPSGGARGTQVPVEPADEAELKKVLLLVRNAVGVDFSEYKTSTIRRRLARRMALRRQATTADYLRLLRDDQNEARALFRDVLIRGIDAAFVPHLFDRFSQEERGRTRAHAGLGLGLAIVRHLVEAHGGTVEAQSAGKGKGSTFTVRLPFERHHEEPHEATKPEAPPSVNVNGIGKARILVVEDDEATRDALAQILSNHGADVKAADSAAEAMALFGEFRPEIVVCDIAMPGEDGYSLLTRIRALADAQGGDVPAVALTALAGEEDRRAGVAAGFQVYLAKPVDAGRLVAALAALRPSPPT
jgi:chemotaxis response regulator CheB